MFQLTQEEKEEVVENCSHLKFTVWIYRTRSSYISQYVKQRPGNRSEYINRSNFTQLKELLLTRKDILLQLQRVENKLTDHDADIKLIVVYLKKLLNVPPELRKRIVFKPDS